MKSLFILCSLGAATLFAMPDTGAPVAVQDANEASMKKDETGGIMGKVTFDGERPKAKPDLVIKEAESQGCNHADKLDKKDRTLLIDKDGGVANIVLTLEIKGMEPMVPKEAIVVDQDGCRFEPHVQIVPVGATLKFLNSDGTNHNVHTYAKKNQPQNKNVAGGDHFEQKLEKAEVIDVKCDIHPWMNGYVVVTDAAFSAKTAADGSFKLEGLPPGSYKLSWWHEELGKGKTEEIEVKAGAMANLEHSVGTKAKKAGGGRRRR